MHTESGPNNYIYIYKLKIKWEYPATKWNKYNALYPQILLANNMRLSNYFDCSIR